MLTGHWFLIVLSQVDQIPQSWVELIHHTLCWAETAEWTVITFKVQILMREQEILKYTVIGMIHLSLQSRQASNDVEVAAGRAAGRKSYWWSCSEQNRTDDEQYSKKKQQNKPIYGAKCLCDKNNCSCWATWKDDRESLRSLHKFTPKLRMQGITKPPEVTSGIDRSIKMEQYLSLNLM